MAGEISAQTARDIPFNNLPANAYAGILVQAGLPQAFADILADSDTAAAEGALYSESTDLEDLIGHPTETLKQFVRTQVG